MANRKKNKGGNSKLHGKYYNCPNYVLNAIGNAVKTYETLNKEEIANIFKKVKKVKPRAPWTGSQNRTPSNQPPVALKPAKIKVIEEDKPVKKTAAKKSERDLNKDVNE